LRVVLWALFIVVLSPAAAGTQTRLTSSGPPPTGTGRLTAADFAPIDSEIKAGVTHALQLIEAASKACSVPPL